MLLAMTGLDKRVFGTLLWFLRVPIYSLGLDNDPTLESILRIDIFNQTI